MRCAQPVQAIGAHGAAHLRPGHGRLAPSTPPSIPPSNSVPSGMPIRHRLSRPGVVHSAAAVFLANLSGRTADPRGGYPVVITEFGDAIGGSVPAFASTLLPIRRCQRRELSAWTWDLWPGYTANVLITDVEWHTVSRIRHLRQAALPLPGCRHGDMQLTFTALRLIARGGAGIWTASRLIPGGWHSDRARTRVDDRADMFAAQRSGEPARLDCVFEPGRTMHAQRRLACARTGQGCSSV